ncbi:uncharacterized protein LOC107269153 [Cephus cinctus]|uniref:Uncharacterized protein LOC107269153 n=1 Tax=Cephus cinctus TaxID=211228 RepID=A0AAJ7RJL5_CEPCN|nr:uncharacterized protein LOC107269153 [Cephus cinctus]
METSMKAPPPLSFDGNVKENWLKWKQRFDLYMEATELDTKPEARRIAVFLHTIGEEALEKYNTFNLSADDKKKFDAVAAAFENYCTPKANETVERHVFFTRVQQSDENFTNYLTDLKKLSATCGFDHLRDGLIKDRIVCGIRDTELKNCLLREEDLNLEKCIKICRAVELTEIQTKTIGDEAKVHAVKKSEKHAATGNSRKQTSSGARGNNSGGSDKARSSGAGSKASGGAGRSSPSSSNQQRTSCQRCGRQHTYRQCPAYGKECNICKRKNHFAKMCRSKNSSEHRDDKVDSLYVGSLNSSNNEFDWMENTTVNNSRKIEVKLDSGTRCNVLPSYKLKNLKLKNVKIEKTNVKLTAYGGQRINVVGKCRLNCKFVNRENVDLEFVVTENTDDQPVIIGLPSLMQLNTVQRVHNIKASENSNNLTVEKILNKHKKVFEGIGCVTNFEYDIQLKEDAKPTIAACRKIPIALNDQVKKELDKMEKDGIIKKVTEPTDWVHPIVISKKKNGQIRICIDPTEFNKFVKRYHRKIPTFDELSSDIAGSKVFSVLDADRALHQIKLSERSSYMMTIITPFGRYRYLRMPFGINSATEVFQDCFEEIFGNIEGVDIYVDDVRVRGRNQKEHDLRLEKVLERAEQRNVKFKFDKCKISSSEVKYMGHVFTEQGIKLDTDRVKSIVDMKPPKDKKELETFLGMITYVSRFIPSLATKNAVLRELTKKNVQWNWDENANKAFTELKEILCKAPVLQYYDVNEPVVLSVDASKSGLGAVLLQNGLPVAYASKALTQTEQRYAQIEKEVLAIAFGCIKFDQQIYGKEILVESDHKPLEANLKKCINDCPARLQSIRLRLKRYNLTVKYKPG